MCPRERTDEAASACCSKTPLPPPQNPHYVEDLIDDVYPDPPQVPAGWVHIRSAASVSVAQFREEQGGLKGGSAEEEIFNELSSSFASSVAGGAKWAAEGAWAAASSAAKSAKSVNERFHVLDKAAGAAKVAAASAKIAAVSAMETAKRYEGRKQKEEKARDQIRKSIGASIELAKRKR